MATASLDINCDCGESFGNWRMGADAELMPAITTANVACGFHAGDPLTMLRTIDLAAANDVAVGAHPGLPDLMGFGRRRMQITPDEAYAYVTYQAGALAGMLATRGMALHHVKPHGALYLMLNEDADLAEAVVRAIIDVCPSPRLYWPAPVDGRALPEAARAAGVTLVREVYFDLEYDANASLVLQREKRPVDLEDMKRRLADYLATGEITATTGERLSMPAESLCVHGDGPNAPEVARTLREVLSDRSLAVEAAE
ncbi:MAG: 5-oxoprolinase subunit PxpA [Azospirillaceae bacterium]